MRKIFGVDLASGSPKARQPPSYALYLLEGDKGSTDSMISKHKLVRLIRQMVPEIVAVDNVHELAYNRSGLVSLLRLFPPETLLVQVTGGDKKESLQKVARRYGISFDRLNPSREAEACARLAAMGVGHVLLAFEDRTWIKVSRRRSPGRGGWSQKRYSRKIHGSVKSAARDVERELRKSGLNFSARAVEGIGGYIRCEFTVEAPRERVPIKQGFRGDAQIKVEGIERTKFHFQPLVRERRYIIAGVDPGTTTGLAALNLRGDLVDVTSGRAISSSGVTEWLASMGRPLIVATDVFPTPGAVEKIKRSFNSVLYSPGMDIPTEEKIALAKGFGYKNDHERDALAAAFSAYRKYRNKFQQVEKKCPPEIDSDEVKALVVRGYPIETAISELMALPVIEAPAEKDQEDMDFEVVKLRRARERLVEQIRTQRAYIEDLRSDLASKDEALHSLERTLEKLKDKSYHKIKHNHEIKIRDKEIERLRGLLRSERKRIRRLKSEIKRLKQAEALEEMEGAKRVKVVDSFSKEAVFAACDKLGIVKGDVILLLDASGGGPNTADLLIEREVLAVIIESEMAPATREYFADRKVPVLEKNEVEVKKINSTAFVYPNDLEAAIERWAERRKADEARRKAEWLEQLVEEYRLERRRDARQSG